MKDFLNKILPKGDKLKHFFLGTLFFIFVSAFFSQTIGLFSVIILAFVVEAVDAFQKDNSFDIVDAFYTVIAPVLIYLIF